MLESLLGSQSAVRILLFLLVHERGYLSQIQQAYEAPLTPLQSMLQKLEKGGIVSFDMQGKRKLYSFHPDYPLLKELKMLLQKGFTHLPAEDKKRLLARQEKWTERSFRKRKETALCLQNFWERLQLVKHVTIRSETAGEALGEVMVTREKKGVLLFTERGRWVSPLSPALDFHNCLRWSLDHENGMIGLEHLRHGPDHPVFLFHLSPLSARRLQSIDSHLCRHDCYFGQIEFSPSSIEFSWRILGPHKNEILQHSYR